MAWPDQIAGSFISFQYTSSNTKTETFTVASLYQQVKNASGQPAGVMGVRLQAAAGNGGNVWWGNSGDDATKASVDSSTGSPLATSDSVGIATDNLAAIGLFFETNQTVYVTIALRSPSPSF